MVRELVKDLENMKGAVASNYKTFPVAYGEKNAKKMSIFLIILAVITISVLLNHPAISSMKYYFYVAGVSLFIIGFILFKSSKKQEYIILHNTLKILLLVGVLSLVLIDSSSLLDKVLETLN
jgi:4-hydroxybenzoate polyprenyltransferase